MQQSTKTEEQQAATNAYLTSWLEAGKGGYTTEQLEQAFKLVANKEHWKNDIEAVVPADHQNILEYAIPWFVGNSEMVFEDAGDGNIKVTATGYWSNGLG